EREVATAIGSTPEQLLDGACRSHINTEFSEHLRRHDRTVTPVLRHIHSQVEAGLDDEHWYEDELYFLLHRMIALQGRDRAAAGLVPARRPSTRREVYRRLGLAADFINTNFAQSIDLRQIAAAALLSPYHCLRMFKSVYGRTPHAYLRDKRLRAAHNLLSQRD